MHIPSEYKIKLLQNFRFCTYVAVTWFAGSSPKKCNQRNEENACISNTAADLTVHKVLVCTSAAHPT